MSYRRYNIEFYGVSKRCNNKKGDHLPEEVDMVLQRKPKAPHRINFIRDFIGIHHHSWRPYLFIKNQ